MIPRRTSIICKMEMETIRLIDIVFTFSSARHTRRWVRVKLTSLTENGRSTQLMSRTKSNCWMKCSKRAEKRFPPLPRFSFYRWYVDETEEWRSFRSEWCSPCRSSAQHPLDKVFSSRGKCWWTEISPELSSSTTVINKKIESIRRCASLSSFFSSMERIANADWIFFSRSGVPSSRKEF